MVGNHRTIYNETLIYLSLNLNPFYAKKVNSFCKMNPLGFLYPIHQLLTCENTPDFSGVFLRGTGDGT